MTPVGLGRTEPTFFGRAEYTTATSPTGVIALRTAPSLTPLGAPASHASDVSARGAGTGCSTGEPGKVQVVKVGDVVAIASEAH